MEHFQKLFREATRLRADEKLWNRIAHSIQLREDTALPSHSKVQSKKRFYPLWIGGALAGAALFTLALLLPQQMQQDHDEEWREAYSKLYSESSKSWDEEYSNYSEELTNTLIAWIDNTQGEAP